MYSVAYGSVPIFIPQLYPHRITTRATAWRCCLRWRVFTGCALWELVTHAGKAQPLLERFAHPVALMLCVLNTIFMAHAVPLVLKEAMVNSRGRLSIDNPLAQQLLTFRPGAPILMENSDHVGALQQAGIPLRQTIGPSDYYRWRDAMAEPAKKAAYVVSIGDDAVAQAVKAHPDGLTELSIMCSTNQPCVRIYQSDVYGR